MGKNSWTIFVSARGVSVALPYPAAKENRQDSWKKKGKFNTVTGSYLNKYEMFCKVFIREILCIGRKGPTEVATVPKLLFQLFLATFIKPHLLSKDEWISSQTD